MGNNTGRVVTVEEEKKRETNFKKMECLLFYKNRFELKDLKGDDRNRPFLLTREQIDNFLEDFLKLENTNTFKNYKNHEYIMRVYEAFVLDRQITQIQNNLEKIKDDSPIKNIQAVKQQVKKNGRCQGANLGESRKPKGDFMPPFYHIF